MVIRSVSISIVALVAFNRAAVLIVLVALVANGCRLRGVKHTNRLGLARKSVARPHITANTSECPVTSQHECDNMFKCMRLTSCALALAARPERFVAVWVQVAALVGRALRHKALVTRLAAAGRVCGELGDVRAVRGDLAGRTLHHGSFAAWMF